MQTVSQRKVSLSLISDYDNTTPISQLVTRMHFMFPVPKTGSVQSALSPFDTAAYSAMLSGAEVRASFGAVPHLAIPPGL